MFVSIVAPAYNEEKAIRYYISQVVSYMQTLKGYDWEFVVVNDGSSDDTGNILQELKDIIPQLRVFNHEINRGLGKALETGFAMAQGDIIITMDADGSHNPSVISSLLEKIKEADVAIASRYVFGGGMACKIPLYRRLSSLIGNEIMRRALRWPVHDGTSGYRAYRKECVEHIKNLPAGFEVQVEILKRLKKSGKSFVEVPFILDNRIAGQSKMVYWKLVKPYLTMCLHS